MSLLKVLPAALAVATLSAQQPPESVDALHTVRIDAIAVDARGNPVTTLVARDFELREDGRLMATDEAQFINDGPRIVAIYLDEYHITAGANADLARAALLDVIDRLGPRDLIAVMKPLDSLYEIKLTDDRETARTMVAGLEGLKGNYTPRNAYERSFMVGSNERIEASRTQVAISALSALAVRMGRENDLRKTLLVVTEGFEAPPRSRGQEYLATIDSAIRAANRANVSVYPVDPRPAPDVDAASYEALRSLASATDGRVVAKAAGADDLKAPMGTVFADATGYYMLTYRNAHKEDGQFHPIEVRVKRPRIQVRARSGYWAPSGDDRRGAELLARANEPPVIRLAPPRRISPLIQPWFGLSLGGDGKMRVTFVWEPTAVVPGDAARRQTAARLELTVLNSEDTVLFEGPVRPTGPGMVDVAGREPARASFETEPGSLRLTMKIQDETSRVVDSDVREIAVRDIRGKVAIGTPEFLRARNAREFRTIDNDPEAVPVSSRQFSRTELLLIRFPAYAPNGQQPSVSARLLNRMGQPMRTLEVRSGTDGEHEVDVTLAGLASGDYQIELEATSPAGNVKERLDFRVTS